MAKHIAIDLGATSGRIVVDGTSDEVEIIHRFESSNEIIMGSFYWDIIKIYSEIKLGLKKAFEKYGNEIISIGIDAWGVDYALLDKNEVLVNPIYHYRDGRTHEIFDELNQKIGKKRLLEASGLSFHEYNTIYQLYSQMKKNKDLFQIVKYYLSIPDLIAYFLSGKITNERTHASTTGFYNCSTKDWDWQLIEELGLPKNIFQPINDSGTIIGSMDSQLMEELNVFHDVKIVSCATHDTASAVSTLENTAYISSGTWSLIGINIEKPIFDMDALNSGFTNETSGENKITFVKNIMGMWISNQCVASHYKENEFINWKDLDDKTFKSMSYEGYIDPLDSIFVAPNYGSNTMKKRVYKHLVDKGFDPPASIGDYLIAIYRGLAKAYKKSIEEIESFTGEKVDNIQIIGGGCKNKILNDLTGQETGKNVKTGPIEATALGNLYYQKKAMGV
ncbi:MAG: rhamnulokinase [Sphaerochaeta sp.]